MGSKHVNERSTWAIRNDAQPRQRKNRSPAGGGATAFAQRGRKGRGRNAPLRRPHPPVAGAVSGAVGAERPTNHVSERIRGVRQAQRAQPPSVRERPADGTKRLALAPRAPLASLLRH